MNRNECYTIIYVSGDDLPKHKLIKSESKQLAFDITTHSRYRYIYLGDIDVKAICVDPNGKLKWHYLHGLRQLKDCPEIQQMYDDYIKDYHMFYDICEDVSQYNLG